MFWCKYNKLYIVCTGAVMFQLPEITSAMLSIPVINQSISQSCESGLYTLCMLTCIKLVATAIQQKINYIDTKHARKTGQHADICKYVHN